MRVEREVSPDRWTLVRRLVGRVVTVVVRGVVDRSRRLRCRRCSARRKEVAGVGDGRQAMTPDHDKEERTVTGRESVGGWAAGDGDATAKRQATRHTASMPWAVRFAGGGCAVPLPKSGTGWRPGCHVETRHPSPTEGWTGTASVRDRDAGRNANAPTDESLSSQRRNVRENASRVRTVTARSTGGERGRRVGMWSESVRRHRIGRPRRPCAHGRGGRLRRRDDRGARVQPAHRGAVPGLRAVRHGVRQAGSAAVDYLGIVAVIAILMASLVTLRPHRAGPRSPVNPITPVVRLLGHPLLNLTPKPATPPNPRGSSTKPRPKPRAKRALRPSREPVTVLLPEWWDRR